MTGLNLKTTLIALGSVFVVGVAALGTFGAGFLKQLEVSNATVDYLDLARQAAEQRKYDQAEVMYKRAIAEASLSGSESEAVMYATAAYSDFLRKQKRPAEAVAVEKEAMSIHQHLR